MARRDGEAVGDGRWDTTVDIVVTEDEMGEVDMLCE